MWHPQRRPELGEPVERDRPSPCPLYRVHAIAGIPCATVVTHCDHLSVPPAASRGTSRGPGACSFLGALGILSGQVSASVQAERLGRRAVLMVSRRSTVRFRKGAPGQRLDSKDPNKLVGPKVGPTGLQPGVIVTGCGQVDVLHPMGVMKPPAVPPELVPVPVRWRSGEAAGKGTRPGLHQRPGRGDDPVLASSGARLAETVG
jgi:hypothetical protein